MATPGMPLFTVEDLPKWLGQAQAPVHGDYEGYGLGPVG
jgi:hypothetical protein